MKHSNQKKIEAIKKVLSAILRLDLNLNESIIDLLRLAINKRALNEVVELSRQIIEKIKYKKDMDVQRLKQSLIKLCFPLSSPHRKKERVIHSLLPKELPLERVRELLEIIKENTPLDSDNRIYAIELVAVALEINDPVRLRILVKDILSSLKNWRGQFAQEVKKELRAIFMIDREFNYKKRHAP